MKSSDPLLVAWEKTLADKPDAAAIFETSGKVSRTFGEIARRDRHLQNQIGGLDRGDVIAVQIGNHPDWPAVMLACLGKGAVVLPLERSIGDQERDAALKICGAKAIMAAVSDDAIEVVQLKPTAAPPVWGNPPALLKLTSGTTASPRAVPFRSEQLLADCDQICRTMGITDADLNFGVIPISHSYGFSNLLTPLLARGVTMVLSSDRLPRAVLSDLDRSNATVFPGMPLFYQAFCEMNEVPALARLRLCISAGAPLSAATATKFREKFRLPIHSFYGASECGGICYDRDGETSGDGFVGQPMEGVDLELIDPDAGSSQIRVRSAAVAESYFPEAENAKLGNGMFVPDDLLKRGGNGFRIVGRISDLINVAGKKVNPAEVEAELLACAGVRQAVVFGRKSSLRNEEVAACVVAESGIAETDLLQFCRGRLSQWQVPKRIFMVEQIPSNERGKTSRRQLAEQFRNR